jgi:hypothetical protein
MCNGLAEPANKTLTPRFSDQPARQGSQLAALADVDPSELRECLPREIDARSAVT